MASPRQNKIIIVLSAVLAAVVIMSVALLVFLPGDAEPVPINEEGSSVSVTDLSDTTSQAAPSAPTTPDQDFNLNGLQRPEYQKLNKQLVQEGALPVKPPAVTGKANPFF